MNGKKARALREQARKHTREEPEMYKKVYRTLKLWYKQGKFVL